MNLTEAIPALHFPSPTPKGRAKSPPAPPPVIRVLVLDDQEDDFAYVKILLERSVFGTYEVEWAPTDQAALARARSGKFDVCLFDYKLGNTTGVDVMRVLHAERCPTPIILLTGSESHEVDQEALDAGAADFIAKSTLENTHLERAIRYAISHAKTLSSLRKTSALLEGVLSNLPMIAGRLDAEGRVVELEGNRLEQHGLTPARLVGQPLASLYPQLAPAIADALAGGAVNSLLNARHEGREWHADFFVFFDRAVGSGALFLGCDITQRTLVERELLRVSDAEKNRIGSDLHDGLGQYLTGISCLSVALRDRLLASKRAEADDAATISSLVQEAIAQTRALARGLCPVQLETSGLEAAFEDLTFQIQRFHGLECSFHPTGPIDICQGATALHIYRIAQEAINNAVKHAAPRRITVTLDFSQENKFLRVEDDGCGFDPSAAARGSSSGLSLMPYRAAMIGGTLAVTSRPGTGTRIECHFVHPQ